MKLQTLKVNFQQSTNLWRISKFMKAIILAAGIGSRLRPITDTIPKCMVSINNKMIIDSQIEGLLDNGIEDIYVASGYKNDVLEDHLGNKYNNVNIVHNSAFRNTNNMYSLFLARSFLKGKEFILLNADVFVHSSVFRIICSSGIENAIVCEKGIYYNESMKICFDEKITSIGKEITREDAYAVSIDIYKFSSGASTKLFEVSENYIDKNGENNLWTEVALNDILGLCDFLPLEIDAPWVEIDDHKDLALAETLFSN